MRIVGDIPHPKMKITIFKMNDKLSVKFETGLVEHIMKFRDGSPLHDLSALKAALKPDSLNEVFQNLRVDVEFRAQLEKKAIIDIEDQFDEII